MRSVEQAASEKREAMGLLGQGLELEGGWTRMAPLHSCLSRPSPPRNSPTVPSGCSKPRTEFDEILKAPGEPHEVADTHSFKAHV